jgi:hypothetical protein
MENEQKIDHIDALVDYNVSETEEGTVYCAGAIIHYEDGSSKNIPGTDYPNDAVIFHSPTDVVKFLAKKTGHSVNLFQVEHFSG